MKNRTLIILAATVFAGAVATGIWSTRLADIRPETISNLHPDNRNSLEAKGRKLLQNAWQAQGMDSFLTHATYTVTGTDHWKGILGRMGKLWPEPKAGLRFDFAIGTFTSRATFLDGKEQGATFGQQDWAFYKLEGDEAVFLDQPDPRITFGLSAFQYFFELADRLKNAPIVYHAGQAQWKGKSYELLFASWETAAPDPAHDQYLLYIDPENYRIKAASYTVRDNYLPGAGNLYGSILFSDFRMVEGVHIPFRQTVFLNGLREQKDNYVHELTLNSFTFDRVAPEELYPDKSRLRLGDTKRRTASR